MASNGKNISKIKKADGHKNMVVFGCGTTSNTIQNTLNEKTIQPKKNVKDTIMFDLGYRIAKVNQ